jgi:hypothetical protein
MKRRKLGALLATSALVALALLPAAASAGEEKEIISLVEGTAVLLDVNTSGGGGAGGNSVPASSMTNIFSPSVLVDYKRFGGEPSIAVDRYPFPGTSTDPEDQCPAGQTTCFKDIVYQSAPQGVVDPHYSQFWKSDDRGLSFRKSQQFPIHGLEQTNAGGGGGDSHQAIGELTHNVYFVDLTLAPGITMNVSEDLGETWRSDAFGEGLSFLDDRQWVEADESVDRIYVSTINLADAVAPALVSIENTTGWPTPLQLTEECNPATYNEGIGTSAAPATGATFCPNPADPYLWVAGPVVADNEGTAARPPSHNAYIPFIRRISEPLGTGLFGIDAWQLWVARSADHGHTWTRHLVAILPNTVNPSQIFPQLTIDRGGNLYYTWSQAQALTTSAAENRPEETHAGEGEQDVYYAWSTTAGATWSPPINLTKEQGDSAIFPWLVAGDPGQVDIVMYKANTGLNSNIAFFDENGLECEDPEEDPNCRPNLSVWNVFFGQSQNALNTGPNFKLVQVTAEPHHIGQICSGGLSCEGDRDLLDFFTVDVDHLGAAHVAYSHDHRSRNSDTQDRMTRQIAGNSVFKGQTLNLQSLWPETNHTITDRAADVTNTSSQPVGACTGMDVLKTTTDRKDSVLTVTMTLNGAPTAANAIACGQVVSSGGIWGAEFWAPSSTLGGTDRANQFYVAFRNDLVNGARVEGGTVDHVNVLVTSLEYNDQTPGTLGGTCFPLGPMGPPATGVCTISMTVDLSTLGIKPGDALNSLTGLSLYFFGDDNPPPLTRVIAGNSEQADATAPINYQGTAQTR